MSVKDVEKQNLEEEVVANESVERVVSIEESKKTKILNAAKKALKVVGVALAGGLVGYAVGSKSNKKDECYAYPEASNIVETEDVDSDVE